MVSYISCFWKIFFRKNKSLSLRFLGPWLLSIPTYIYWVVSGPCQLKSPLWFCFSRELIGFITFVTTDIRSLGKGGRQLIWVLDKAQARVAQFLGSADAGWPQTSVLWILRDHPLWRTLPRPDGRHWWHHGTIIIIAIVIGIKGSPFLKCVGSRWALSK